MILFCDQAHNYWFEQIYWPYTIDSPHNSKHLFDIYSLTHVFWLLLLSMICKNLFENRTIPIIFLIFLSTLFEIHENSSDQIIKYNRIEVNSLGQSSYRGDSLINSLGDIFCNIIGIYIGYNYSNTVNIAVLILLFLVITYTVGFSYWTDFFKFMFK